MVARRGVYQPEDASGFACSFRRAAQQRQDDLGRAILRTRISQDIRRIWPDRYFGVGAGSPIARSESPDFVIELASRDRKSKSLQRTMKRPGAWRTGL